MSGCLTMISTSAVPFNETTSLSYLGGRLLETRCEPLASSPSVLYAEASPTLQSHIFTHVVARDRHRYRHSFFSSRKAKRVQLPAPPSVQRSRKQMRILRCAITAEQRSACSASPTLAINTSSSTMSAFPALVKLKAFTDDS